MHEKGKNMRHKHKVHGHDTWQLAVYMQLLMWFINLADPSFLI